MWLVSWLGNFHVSIKILNDHRDLLAPTVTLECQREKRNLWLQRVSVWEHLPHENHALRVNLHKGVRNFGKHMFSNVEAGRKSRESKTFKLSSTCLLVLLGETLWCGFFSVLRSLCYETLLYVPFYIVRAYDVVLWDTVMCTSLCRQVVGCGAVRHCNVYLSLSSCLMVWCCETL